jgi:hypothetical protein
MCRHELTDSGTNTLSHRVFARGKASKRRYGYSNANVMIAYPLSQKVSLLTGRWCRPVQYFSP